MKEQALRINVFPWAILLLWIVGYVTKPSNHPVQAWMNSACHWCANRKRCTSSCRQWSFKTVWSLSCGEERPLLPALINFPSVCVCKKVCVWGWVAYANAAVLMESRTNWVKQKQKRDVVNVSEDFLCSIFQPLHSLFFFWTDNWQQSRGLWDTLCKIVFGNGAVLPNKFCPLGLALIFNI